MRRYTPVEILQAGADDTRRTHAHLYLELERLQAALCWHWHRVNIDPDLALLDGEERLPTYPPGPAFGGNTVAVPTRSVNLARLTPAGRYLYRIGCRAALTERGHLISRILDTRTAVDDAAVSLTHRERQALAQIVIHAAETAHHRATRHPPTPVTGDSWAVKVPGTTTWKTPPPTNREEHR